MKQTAIEWLKDKLKETYEKEGKLPLAYTLHLIEQAKQMEKEQMLELIQYVRLSDKMGKSIEDLYNGFVNQNK